MGQKEPPSSLEKLLFMIGKNSKGQWVVQDEAALHGGLFVNRTEALKYALFENGNRPQAVVTVPGVLELDTGGKRRLRNSLAPDMRFAQCLRASSEKRA